MIPFILLPLPLASGSMRQSFTSRNVIGLPTTGVIIRRVAYNCAATALLAVVVATAEATVVAVSAPTSTQSDASSTSTNLHDRPFDHSTRSTRATFHGKHGYSSSASTTELCPRDILMDSTLRVALDGLVLDDEEKVDLNDDRNKNQARKKIMLIPSYLYHQPHWWEQYHHVHDEQQRALTLTMVGYKGKGSLQDQINQDRGFVILYDNRNNTDNPNHDSHTDFKGTFILSGVMDGHGQLGHYVADWAMHVLLEKICTGLHQLQSTLVDHINPTTRIVKQNSTTTTQQEEEDETIGMISQLLQSSFVEAHHSLPEHLSNRGGCTTSLALQYNGLLYMANAGDSQTIVGAIVHPNPLSSFSTTFNAKRNIPSLLVIFETRLDKPTHPDEAKRLREMGAQVQADPDDPEDVRVWYRDPQTGMAYGLAMSRSIGDRQVTGVTAIPMISVLNVTQLKHQIVYEYNSNHTLQCDKMLVVDDSGDVSNRDKVCDVNITIDQVDLFVISATDGIIDFVTPKQLVNTLGRSLYLYNHTSSVGSLHGNHPPQSHNTNDNNNAKNIQPKVLPYQHPLVTMRDLMYTAADYWHAESQGHYRDDMTLAIAKVSLQ